MYLLHLTGGFTPFWDRGDAIKVIDNTLWTGGEVKFRIDQSFENVAFDEVIRITTRLNTGDDIMRLIMATDALRRLGWERIELFIPYVPYARQDRVCNIGEPHGLRVFADLINAQKYERVLTLDPHSYVTEAVIDRCVAINNHEFIEEALEKHIAKGLQEFVLISPDTGAEKKVRSVSAAISRNENLNYAGTFFAQKVRNAAGEVVETHIDLGDGHLEDRIAVIVDDICDAGRSFYPLAEALKKKHAKTVVLAVTHGIFSFNFCDNFSQHGIDQVVATNSIRNWTPDVTTIKIEDLF